MIDDLKEEFLKLNPPKTPVEQREIFWKNKWRLSAITTFTTDNGQEVSKLFETMIPPEAGDRIDIITERGKYYCNTTKDKFMARMSKEEYLDKIMPKILIEDKKERKEFEKTRKKALKEMNWTPYKTTEKIAIIIEIKGGEITLKGK